MRKRRRRWSARSARCAHGCTGDGRCSGRRCGWQNRTAGDHEVSRMTEQNYDDAVAELGRTAGMDAGDRRRARAPAGAGVHRVSSAHVTLERLSVARARGGGGLRRRQRSSSSRAGYRGGGRVAGGRTESKCLERRWLRRLRLRRSRTSVVAVPQPVPAKPAAPAPSGSTGRPVPRASSRCRAAAGCRSSRAERSSAWSCLSRRFRRTASISLARGPTVRSRRDVLVGQDGQPRAIRLVSSGSARTSRSQ